MNIVVRNYFEYNFWINMFFFREWSNIELWKFLCANIDY